MNRSKSILRIGTLIITVCVCLVVGYFIENIKATSDAKVVPMNDERIISETVEEFYVSDNAEIFSSEEVYSMNEQLKELAEKENGVQIIVFTMSSMEELKTEDQVTPEKAVNDLYKNYDIDKNDNMVLITYFDKENEVIVSCGNDDLASTCESILVVMENDYIFVGNAKEVIIQLQSALVNQLNNPLTTKDLVDYYDLTCVSKTSEETEKVNVEVINLFTEEVYYCNNNMQ